MSRKSIQAPSGEVRTAAGLTAGDPSWANRAELIFAVALSALLIALHIYRITQAGPLWRDEAITAQIATQPTFSRIWAALSADSFPLLIYASLRSWLSVPWFGNSDISIRVFGALIGIGTIVALWVSKRLMGNRLPLISLALIGLNATVFMWGDTMRAYGLGVLLIAITYGAVWRVVDLPAPKQVAAAAILALLSVQCMYQNAFLLFAICSGGALVCLSRRKWARALVPIGIGAVAALSLLPYLSIIKSDKALHSMNQTDMFDFTQLLFAYRATMSSDFDFVFWVWLISFGITLVGAIYFIAAPPKGARTARSRDLAIYGLVVLVIGNASFFWFLMAGRLMNFISQRWYYMAIVGLSALAVETGIDLVTRTVWSRMLRIAVCLAIAAMTVPKIVDEARVRQSNIDRIATILEERAAPDDLILVNPYFFSSTFDRYYHGKTPWLTVPPVDDVGIYSFVLVKRQMTAPDPLAPLWPRMERVLSAGRYVWLVGSMSFFKGVPPPPPGPNEPNGLWQGIYQQYWERQVGHFLALHAERLLPVNLQIAEPVCLLESPDLRRFEGWRP